MTQAVVDKYRIPQTLGPRAPRRFHVMAKPVGSACNLECTYCYYLSKEKHPGMPGLGRISDEILEAFVRDYITSVTGDEVVFSWQGGEPTLLGVGWFEKVVTLQRKYAKSGQRIENDLQTNGTLLDDDWARFLKQHKFLVGLSIDGPREVHDAMRPTKHRQPTFDDVKRGAALLKRHGVPFNTLTCVHPYNASRPLDVYRFLRRELGSTYMQFIPIVERTSIMRAIDRRALEIAVAELHAVPNVKFAINISGLTAIDRSWQRMLAALVRGKPEIAERMIIEITETVALQDIDETAQFVNSVRDLGCRISLDDFGAGYTSFRYLKMLAINCVKIDGSFVRGLTDNIDNQLFIRTLLGLADGFGLSTVAECVETAAEAALLERRGVHYLQGYHFGAPTVERPWDAQGRSILAIPRAVAAQPAN